MIGASFVLAALAEKKASSVPTRHLKPKETEQKTEKVKENTKKRGRNEAEDGGRTPLPSAVAQSKKVKAAADAVSGVKREKATPKGFTRNEKHITTTPTTVQHQTGRSTRSSSVKSPAPRQPASQAPRNMLRFGDVITLRHTSDIPLPLYASDSNNHSDATKTVDGGFQCPYRAYVVVRVITLKEAQALASTCTTDTRGEFSQILNISKVKAGVSDKNRSKVSGQTFVCLQDSHNGRLTTAFDNDNMLLYDPTNNSHDALFEEIENMSSPLSKNTISTSNSRSEVHDTARTRNNASSSQNCEHNKGKGNDGPILSESAMVRTAISSMGMSRMNSVAKLRRDLKHLAAITAQDRHFSRCEECGQPGTILMCDTCAYCFHFECCTPPLVQNTVPQVEYRCHYCRGLNTNYLAETFVEQVSKLIANLFALDTEAVFHQPVCVQFVAPKYLNKVGVPMDLATIEFKHKARCYGKLSHVHADVDLMVTNCLNFNRSTDPDLVAYAKNFSEAVLPLFEGSRCVDFPTLPPAALLKVKGKNRDRITGKLPGAPLTFPQPHAANNRNRIHHFFGPLKVHVVSPYPDAQIIFTLTAAEAGSPSSSRLNSGTDMLTTSMRVEAGAKHYREPIFITRSSILQAMVARPSQTGGASQTEYLPMPPVHYIITSLPMPPPETAGSGADPIATDGHSAAVIKAEKTEKNADEYSVSVVEQQMTPFEKMLWTSFLERITALGSNTDEPILSPEEIRIYKTVSDTALETNRTGSALVDCLVGVVNRSDALRVLNDFELFQHTNDLIPSTPAQGA